MAFAAHTWWDFEELTFSKAGSLCKKCPKTMAPCLPFCPLILTFVLIGATCISIFFYTLLKRISKHLALAGEWLPRGHNADRYSILAHRITPAPPVRLPHK